MSTSMIPRIESLSFRRTVDVPLEACVAALNDWLQAAHGGELRLGAGQLLGPMAHDHDLGTHRIQVRLARGLLSPLLPMRLDLEFLVPVIDHPGAHPRPAWSGPRPSTSGPAMP